MVPFIKFKIVYLKILNCFSYRSMILMKNCINLVKNTCNILTEPNLVTMAFNHEIS